MSRGPNIPPGRTDWLRQMPICRENCRLKKADALALRVNDPQGRELWTWVWPDGG